MAQNSDYHLNISIDKEACPLQLAPMSSTTATLVMGDAIAAALMRLRNFKDENFALFHPGGSLGRRLLTKIKDVMKKDNLPTCSVDTIAKDIIHTITDGKCGLVVVTGSNQIQGIITDGDIRRVMESQEENFFRLCAKDIMTTSAKLISEDSKLVEASDIMSENKINSLVVINKNNELSGIVQMYDLGI